MKTVHVGAMVSRPIDNALKREARKLLMSKSALIRQIFERHVEGAKEQTQPIENVLP